MIDAHAIQPPTFVTFDRLTLLAAFGILVGRSTLLLLMLGLTGSLGSCFFCSLVEVPNTNAGLLMVPSFSLRLMFSGICLLLLRLSLLIPTEDGANISFGVSLGSVGPGVLFVGLNPLDLIWGIL